MPHSYGQRRRTRQKFRQAFRNHGAIRIAKYLTTYQIGEHVNIKVDGSQHKGMPFKGYHGKTGTVFNVNPRSIGVRLLKRVREKYIEKKINVRVEHLRKSNVKQLFKKHVQENDARKVAAKKEGKVISTKRLPIAPASEVMLRQCRTQFQQTRVFREVF